jgi:hypothetical protein
MASVLRGSELGNRYFREFHVASHPKLAIERERFSEEHGGTLTVTGSIAPAEHPGVPAAHLRLRDAMRQRVRLVQRGGEV